MKRLPVLLFLLFVILITTSRDASPDRKGLRKITLWTFAMYNRQEWMARKPDIEKKFNIQLEIESIAQNRFVQKLRAVMMDGKGVPDIIEWMIENNRIMERDPEQCLVLPLSKYVKRSKIFRTIAPGRVDWVRYGKHVYGLPRDVHPVVLVYNDTIWKSVGIDLAKVETWDEFFNVSKKLIKKRDENGKQLHYALTYSGDGLSDAMYMIWQQTGIQLFDEKGNPQYSSPEMISFLKKWLNWQKIGAFTDWDWGNFANLLEKGILCSYTSPDWWVSQSNRASKKYKLKVRPLPRYKKDGVTGASWGGTFLAIPRGTRYPELVYKIMEYMQYDGPSMVKRWEKTAMLPSGSIIWDEDSFREPDSRFSGQKLGEVFIKVAQDMPRINTSEFFWDALDDFAGEYSTIISGQKSVEEGLQSTQEKIIQRMKK